MLLFSIRFQLFGRLELSQLQRFAVISLINSFDVIQKVLYYYIIAHYYHQINILNVGKAWMNKTQWELKYGDFVSYYWRVNTIKSDNTNDGNSSQGNPNLPLDAWLFVGIATIA